ncbi:kinase-like domain-containing protein [Tanacetum coccineum]
MLILMILRRLFVLLPPAMLPMVWYFMWNAAQTRDCFTTEFARLRRLVIFSCRKPQLPPLRRLYLDAYKFSGVIPANLSSCSNLEDLHLGQNKLLVVGSIPKEMSLLSKLSLLVIQQNKLTGGIPPYFGNTTSMEVFAAAKNPFGGDTNVSGKLTIDFSKLRDVDSIILHDNNFHGRGKVDDMRFIDSLKNCSRLVTLELANCNLKGVLPISIGNLSDQLKFLNLGENQLFESLPSSIGTITNSLGERVSLTTLNLRGNQFQGIIPSSLSSLGGLESKFYIFRIEELSKVFWQNVKHGGIFDTFMPNGSVHDWLHSSAITSKLRQRITILKDVATPLDYPHIRCQTTIVHSDLKPSNILLDDDMVAHVGDFGLARLLGTDLNQNSSTGVKGTIGYAPPEVMTGKKPTDGMFNEGLSLHKFAYMALPDHAVDVIDNDAIVLQSTETNAKKVEECLACN